MKSALSVIYFLVLSCFVFSQQSANDVTKWKTSVKQDGENAELIIEATTDKGWHGYSIFEVEDGPLPTEITFEQNDNFELIGSLTESGMHEKYDDVFEADVKEFSKATFKQQIKILSDKDFIIQGNVFYQVCQESGMCIIGDKAIDFAVDGYKEKSGPKNDETTDNQNDESLDATEEIDGKNSDEISIDWDYHIKEIEKNGKFVLELTPDIPKGYKVKKPENLQSQFELSSLEGMEINPFMLSDGDRAEEGYYISTPKFRTTITYSGDDTPAIPIKVNLNLKKDDDVQLVSSKVIVNFQNAELIASGKCEPKKYADDDDEGFSYWELMIEAFLWGIASLLTPCVFPMIPMTVTFFLKDAENKSRIDGIKKASTYGFSIIAIYTLIGTIVAVTLGAAFANWLATHWVPNTLFFLIFMFFAASFLGMFEIRLPSWMINKTDKKADQGGFMGTFFMALTLVLVSFSCTGPIVGIILIKASQGAVIEPMLGMFAFSLAFALPFTLFAIFPSWLSRLPQSGGWLNTVKVVLGFLEIALGLKFLSVADQTYHWGLLDREIYIGLWIVIFTMLGIYLLGKLKFAHDSDIPYLKVPRLFLAMLTFSFVVYLVPGLFGHPLKALSGYLPPMSTHDFDLLGEIRGEDENQCGDEPRFSDFLHLPHGIAGYFDYEEALACARAQNKPLFIDFTGHGCVNCREMEAQVWSDPKILKMLKEKFVVVALYADDKTVLPESEWVESKVDGKMKKTIGDINLDFQICNFDESAQPLYVTLDNKENLLEKPIGYVSKDKFEKLLEQSLVNFKRQQKGKSPI